MDTTDLTPLIDLLEDSIDDLEEALLPLLKGALSDTAGKLPLLDKAQLYVLVTYAVESILFSYIRLNGVNAKEHLIFRELTRVKQYFEKVQNASSGADKRRLMSLDKPAAGRFLRHALAGNQKCDFRRAEHLGKDSDRSHLRFEQDSKKRKPNAVESLASLKKEASSSSSDSNSSVSRKSDEDGAKCTANIESRATGMVARLEMANVLKDLPNESGNVRPNKKQRKRKRQSLLDKTQPGSEGFMVPNMSLQASTIDSVTSPALPPVLTSTLDNIGSTSGKKSRHRSRKTKSQPV